MDIVLFIYHASRETGIYPLIDEKFDENTVREGGIEIEVAKYNDDVTTTKLSSAVNEL